MGSWPYRGDTLLIKPKYALAKTAAGYFYEKAEFASFSKKTPKK